MPCRAGHEVGEWRQTFVWRLSLTQLFFLRVEQSENRERTSTIHNKEVLLRL